MTDQVSEVPQAPRSAEEQSRSEIKEMAQDVLRTADEIIDERRLSKDPKGSTLAWLVHATKPDQGRMASVSAIALDTALKHGTIQGEGIPLPIGALSLEGGMYFYGNHETAHTGLAVDVVKRLGFLDDTSANDLQRFHNSRQGEYVFSNPTKPYEVKGEPGGFSSSGKPLLKSLLFVPKAK